MADLTPEALAELRNLLAESAAAPNRAYRIGAEDRLREALLDHCPALLRAAEENAELRAALAGKTGACVECERLAKERDDAKTLAVAAFVQGAAWARFQITGATAFPSENDEAEDAAKARYPFVPPFYRVELETVRALNEALRRRVRHLESIEANDSDFREKHCEARNRWAAENATLREQRDGLVDAMERYRHFMPDLSSAPKKTKIENLEAAREVYEALRKAREGAK